MESEMKVGDLITGVHGNEWFGHFGTVIGFDEDNDPIVAWNGAKGSNERSPGCGEYREGLVAVNAPG
jgi:hypothetical protein